MTLTVKAMVIMPAVWSLFTVLRSTLVVNDFQRLHLQVATAGSGLLAIWENINTCAKQDGSWVAGSECAHLIATSLFALGLSYLRYHFTGEWWKRSDLLEEYVAELSASLNGTHIIQVYGDKKRAHNELDEYLTSLNIPLLHVSPSMQKRDGINEDFILGLENNTFHYISPTAQVLYDEKRDGVNGYKGLKGAVTVYANSDPVANDGDVRNWMDTDTHQPDPNQEESVFNYLMNYVIDHETDDMIAVSLTEKMNGLDGQFIMRSYSHKWTDWESGLNWCYGPYKTNCQ